MIYCANGITGFSIAIPIRKGAQIDYRITVSFNKVFIAHAVLTKCATKTYLLGASSLFQ